MAVWAVRYHKDTRCQRCERLLMRSSAARQHDVPVVNGPARITASRIGSQKTVAAIDCFLPRYDFQSSLSAVARKLLFTNGNPMTDALVFRGTALPDGSHDESPIVSAVIANPFRSLQGPALLSIASSILLRRGNRSQ